MARAHWLALTYLPHLGGATLRRLLHRYGSLEALWDVPHLGLAHLNMEAMAEELNHWEQRGVTMLTWDDSAYPQALYRLTSPPPVLFLRGHIQPQDAPAVAIVGSRQVSERSLMTAREVAAELAQAGWTIISGLAMGIDTAGHEGALRHPDGRTWAILGNGLQHIYPPQNLALAEQISQRGAILSELHPSTPIDRQNLIIRNRLIAALSPMVIVVEASLTSGALATARQAQQLGHSVWVYPDSPGTKVLLQNGARPLMWGESALIACQAHPPTRWTQPSLF